MSQPVTRTMLQAYPEACSACFNTEAQRPQRRTEATARARRPSAVVGARGDPRPQDAADDERLASTDLLSPPTALRAVPGLHSFVLIFLTTPAFFSNATLKFTRRPIGLRQARGACFHTEAQRPQRRTEATARARRPSAVVGGERRSAAARRRR